MLLLFNLILFGFVFKCAQSGIHQKRLLEMLFKKYNPMERPVEDEMQLLNVSIGMSLQQIVDVDEKKQTILFSGWLDMTWSDYNLQWNPAEYGNISVLRIMSTKIWMPDLLLYNSADDSFDTTAKVNAVIHHNGSVNYLPPGMFKATCTMKIDDFPFDEQKCSLKFGSWTHDEGTVNLTNKRKSSQLDSYIKNGEWILEGVSSYSQSIFYECCPQKYPFVMFEIHLRRRTLYFVVNLIFPCILISFMSVVGFALPPDSGEKIALEITTLLSIIMFSQIITSIIPESSLSVPKIAIYFASVMVISGMSIVANVFVLMFHHRNVRIQKPMPRWVDVLICKYLATVLRMKRPERVPSYHNYDSTQHQANGDLINQTAKYSFANETKPAYIKKKTVNKSNVLYDSDAFYSNYNFNRHLTASPDEHLLLSSPTSPAQTARLLKDCDYGKTTTLNDYLSSYSNKSELNGLRKHLHLILKEIRLINLKLKREEGDEESSLNWKFAAMVIDRLCMILFIIATIFSNALILSSKNFFKSSNPSENF